MKKFPRKNEKNILKIDLESDNTEVFFGRHIVLKIFKDKKQINKLFVQKGLASETLHDIMKLAKQHKVVIHEVPKAKLDELSENGNHQGVVVTIPVMDYQRLEDCFALAKDRDETGL